MLSNIQKATTKNTKTRKTVDFVCTQAKMLSTNEKNLILIGPYVRQLYAIVIPSEQFLRRFYNWTGIRSQFC